MRRRLLVIFNPIAGRHARRRLDAALDALKGMGVEAVVRETQAPGDATIIARTARAAEFDAIAIGGGDGTINEVINGLEDSTLPLAILCLGTANVLAHEIGLPREPHRLAKIAVSGPAHAVALGEVIFENGAGARRFLLVAGIGFDAEVVDRLDLALKRRAGKLAFAWSIFLRLLRYQATEFALAIDGESGARYGVVSAIATRARLYAGRFVLAPSARLSDPRLHLVVFKRGGRWATLRSLAALAGGVLHRLRDIEIVSATSIRLAGPVGAPIQIDGDVLGRLPATIRIAERPVLLVHP